MCSAKPNILKMNKDLEITFTNDIEVIPCCNDYMFQYFSNDFIYLEDFKKITTRVSPISTIISF